MFLLITLIILSVLLGLRKAGANTPFIDKSVSKIGNGLNNASLFRKIYFADGEYEKSGWAKIDVGSIFTE